MIYLNNAGTTWPKPDAVNEAVVGALTAEPGQWQNMYDEAFGTVASFFNFRKKSRFL